MTTTPTATIEQRLRDSLRKDAAKPSRRTVRADGTTTVQISGFSSGLALALELRTGETFEAIMERLSR